MQVKTKQTRYYNIIARSIDTKTLVDFSSAVRFGMADFNISDCETNCQLNCKI